jgi:hypothetical protein
MSRRDGFTKCPIPANMNIAASPTAIAFGQVST